ncbi:family 10 glycosylhydrolase [Jiulongibacter sp. NS-SX5]|uniref:family 10 glycosylhydrolase n=1 Tax=Jiulongibacter sp. NS-SX5 TaxID=3463854 RepID=UPI00405A0DC0
MSKKLFLTLVISSFLLACKDQSIPLIIDEEPSSYDFVYQPTNEKKREFRGVWIASVANIDWPSKKGLSSAEQKAEYVKLADRMADHKLNALLVQIRAATDAFYLKSPEPWSEWLMGEQGKSPSPLYDPMDFMINQTHERGMEFHAWLNLNRGMHKKATSVTEDHLIYKRPEWFLTYDGYKLFNFGLPEVRQYIRDVVMNIVREYDVDGIHFDDYFYPYKVNGQELNDQEAFRKYGSGFTSIEDWRRNNIDLIIKDISESITREKPWVRFGISPFGVWRNKRDDPAGSETRGGQPSYDYLFADTKKWAQEGWIDYIAPQIYFPFEHNLVPFATLTDWWAKNKGEANLYIGHGMYRVDAASTQQPWRDPNQMARKIDYLRYSQSTSGSIYFSAKHFEMNKLGVADTIKNRYQNYALTPVSSGELEEVTGVVNKASIKKSSGSYLLNWSKGSFEKTVVYRFEKGARLNLSDPAKIVYLGSGESYLDTSLKPGQEYIYVIRGLDRYAREGSPIVLET